MSKQRRNRLPQSSGPARTRGTQPLRSRQAPGRGTARRGGHSAYAAYPHEQFAAHHAAEVAKTHFVPPIVE